MNRKQGTALGLGLVMLGGMVWVFNAPRSRVLSSETLPGGEVCALVDYRTLGRRSPGEFAACLAGALFVIGAALYRLRPASAA